MTDKKAINTHKQAQVGRPRDVRVHRAILEATTALLCEVGYSGITIEGIARRARVGKPSIYRRWEHLGLLVYEAVFADFHFGLQAATGDLEQDLKTFVRSVVAELSRTGARAAVTGLLGEFERKPELQRLVFERWMLPVAEAFRGIVLRSQDQEMGDFPAELLLDSLVGMVFFRTLMLRVAVTESDIDRLVTALLRGVTQR